MWFGRRVWGIRLSRGQNILGGYGIKGPEHPGRACIQGAGYLGCRVFQGSRLSQGRVSRGWGRVYPPPPPGHGIMRYPTPPRKNIGPEILYPLERTWDQRPGWNLAPEIPYPLPHGHTDTSLPSPTSLAGGNKYCTINIVLCRSKLECHN